MTGPLTPKFGTDLVVNCPVCHRTIWANSTCHHGRVPPPEAAGVVPDEKPRTVLKGGKVTEPEGKKRGRRD